MQPVRRIPLIEAWAWLDRLDLAAASEPSSVGPDLIGRVLTAAVVSPASVPPWDTVVTDGFAVRSNDVLGASPYNPITLTVGARPGEPACQAVSVVSGTRFPAGFDCILPTDRVERTGNSIEVFDAVPRGGGIVRTGTVLPANGCVLSEGVRLTAPSLLLLSELGINAVEVRRRPRVAVHAFGAKSGAGMSRALLARLVEGHGATVSGGVSEGVSADPAFTKARAGEADLVLLVGRSGWGDDDDAAAQVLNAGGSIDAHGLALKPCDSVGFGAVASVPVLLLPGAPLSTIVAVEVLVTRLLRRWCELPSRGEGEPRTLARKISSPVGMAEWVPVADEGDARVSPIALPSLAATAVFAKADAYTLIPAGAEGFGPGETVFVHRWHF